VVALRSCDAVGGRRLGKVAALTSGLSRMNPRPEGRIDPRLGDGVASIIAQRIRQAANSR
jgi:hypothetical protein